VLIALVNTIISLFYYLLVVKAMYISPEESKIEKFRTSCPERLGLWLTVAGIIALGIVSFFYDSIFDAASISNLFGFIA
jgi:NADH-quinone oxidoreductase subunit N